jgi:hypothetical protein
MVNKKAKSNNFHFILFPEKRKGWIQLIEAFFSIFLITTFLLILVSKESMQIDFNEKIYDEEVKILRSIENNESLREKILNANLPISWEENDFPLEIKEKINQDKPIYLNCSAKICSIGEECLFDSDLDVSIYSRSIGIFASEAEYNPRQLRLFCWEY